MPDQPVICPGCGWEIDPDVCHCGELIKFHDILEHGHAGVPAGCTCGYPDADQRKNPNYDPDRR